QQADPKDLIAMVIPIYDQHLSHADIKGLIQFYQSPLGKKFVSVQPQILNGTMKAGQKWGMQLGQKIIKEVQSLDKEDSKKKK
ncbi:MAG: DUF2059 domain-containing protein, partial [Pseudomonadota bacterium]